MSIHVVLNCLVQCRSLEIFFVLSLPDWDLVVKLEEIDSEQRSVAIQPWTDSTHIEALNRNGQFVLWTCR